MPLSHIHPSLHHLAIAVDELTPDPRNARKHSKRNLDTIKESLTRFQFRQPIVVQREGMVVRVGNGRLQVAKELGWPSVPCVLVDEKDVDAIAYALTDNKASDLAEWDPDNLLSVMTELAADDDLKALGWEGYEIEAIVDGVNDDVLAEAWVEEPQQNTEATKKARSSLKFNDKQWSTLGDILGTKPTSKGLLAYLIKYR